MAQFAAQELDIAFNSTSAQDTTTYQSTNNSPTAASAGSDLNGMAMKDACNHLNDQIKSYREKFGKGAPMRTLARAPYPERVNSAVNGFWKSPRTGYVWEYEDIWTNKQEPKANSKKGVAVSEVELDILTGSDTGLRTNIKIHIGCAIKQAID